MLKLYIYQNILQPTDAVHCQRSDELPTSFFHVRLARIEYVPSKERHSVLLDFQFLESVDAEWSANLHLKVLTLVRNIRDFRKELSLKTKKDGHIQESEVKKKRAIDWRVSFKNETNLVLILSQANNMLFGTG